MSGGAEKFKLHTYEELMALPSPEWLIEGIIETATLGVLYGQSGSGKSFAALDWALSIAMGHAWHERQVKSGPVVYVVGEGTTGIVRRVDAWKRHNDVETLSNAFFLLEAPQLHTDDINRLSATLKDEPEKPALIVIDTLARCFVGGDENTAKDMGAFVQACHRLKAETGAALLIVHHTGKQKSKNKPPTERGSSALRAAADVMIELRKTPKGLIEIVNDKQKEDEEFETLALRLHQVPLGEKNGKALKSCVLVPAVAGDDVPALEPMFDIGLSDSKALALAVLVQSGPLKSGQWHAAIAKKKGTAVAQKTFQNWRSALLDAELVEQVSEQDHFYQATAKGKGVAGGTLSKVA